MVNCPYGPHPFCEWYSRGDCGDFTYVDKEVRYNHTPEESSNIIKIMQKNIEGLDNRVRILESKIADLENESENTE